MLYSFELGWWIVRMIVRPLFAILSRIYRRILAVKLSRPEVGSSSTKAAGFVITSRAMQVLFLSPPETPWTNFPPMGVFWHLISCRSWMSSLTFFSLYF